MSQVLGCGVELGFIAKSIGKQRQNNKFTKLIFCGDGNAEFPLPSLWRCALHITAIIL